MYFYNRNYSNQFLPYKLCLFGFFFQNLQLYLKKYILFTSRIQFKKQHLGEFMSQRLYSSSFLHDFPKDDCTLYLKLFKIQINTKIFFLFLSIYRNYIFISVITLIQSQICDSQNNRSTHFMLWSTVLKNLKKFRILLTLDISQLISLLGIKCAELIPCSSQK